MPKNKALNTKKIADTIQNIRGIVRHIRNVQDNCMILGEKLIELGEIDLGKNLIANGFCHDTSKFYGIEWSEMAPLNINNQSCDSGETKKMKLKMAISHHNQTNFHHPEAWSSIHKMPRLYIAEMVCDWKSRSEEFGSSVRDFIQNQAMNRFKFSEKDLVYKDIMNFVDLVCEKPFTSNDS